MAASPSQKPSLVTKWPLLLVLFILASFFIYVSRQKAPDTAPTKLPATSQLVPPDAAPSPVSPGQMGDVTHPGTFYPSQGHDHWDLTRLQGFKYNSNPPTSGPHMEQFIDSYFPSSPLPPYIQVHLLEHGNVLIQYNCTCPGIVQSLHKIAESFDTYAPSLGLEEGKGVIVAPNPTLPKKIVLSAWTRLLSMDQVDDPTIKKFITVWLGNNQNTHQ
ncbi:MAG: DUF3105 domain-containing protein [Leptospirales bacterium]